MDSEFVIQGPKSVEEIEKVPYLERFPERNTLQAIEAGAAIDPKAVAISFLMNGDAYETPIQVTYGQLIHRIRQCANMFADLGIGPNDVVTYLLPNLPQTHFVLWGAEAAGIVNPINPLLEAGTIRDICRAAKTKVLVALTQFPGSQIWEKVMAIRNEIPTLTHVIRVMGPSDPAENILGFDETIEKYPGDRLTFSRTIQPDDISSLYHTGGTTGTPKLAKRTHFNEVIMGWDIRAMGGLSRSSSLLCGLPLFHVNGTTVTGLAPFSVGAHVVILSPSGYREPTIIKNFFKIVEKYRATNFSAVPTALSTLLDVPVAGADISSLQYAICGAAPLSVELFRRFEAHTGMKILEGYGLTEGACASSINPKDGERKIGSIGIRMPYQEMRVVILDEAGNYVRDAKPNEIGVVAIHGPNVFKGYVEDVHNKGIWIDGDWFNTGDLGRMDEDGYFWLTGRKKELIIRGGHNIDPAAIEEPIYRLPQVKVVASVGKPDPHAGEVPVAYVELVEGAGLTEEAILEHAKQTIGERAAVPKEIIVVDKIPLTPVGKIFKPALRWDAIRRTYSQELTALGSLIRKVDVQVGEDKVHGTLATFHVTPAEGVDPDMIREKIREILARYTVKYEVVFG
ncbi:acyl-CoA synthetase [Desulfatirhabdium butyrativorans]|uniref:acyl-CoA synthetase n=1 Tax=Desulfatirhabdium butyrativorans TaxID=340467 RepID=UPI0004202E94|nr:acyl-CoA synthetase [Desulfatirhabdium butyrativorans]